MSRLEHELVIVFYFPLISLPASLPTTLAHEFWPNGKEWLLLIAIGISTQIAQILLTRGMKHIEAGKAVAIMYLQ
ncbi:MAG TPA: EamA family transporter, partial [Elusimicrobiota bacterium]|nr:EamA family transporter [Elusimicrobiota bacterium]